MSYAKIFPLGSLGSVVNTGVLQIQGGVYLDSTLRILTDQINTPSVLRLSTTSVTNYGGGAIPTNTAFGDQTLLSNTSGSNNTGLGYRSLRANTSGTQNVAVGVDALIANTIGGANTAVGYQSMNATTTGFFNTAIGRDALFANSVGSNNTSIGYRALFSNTASNNTAVGYDTAIFNTTGTGITAIGYQALRLSTGSNNTAVGLSALSANTTASNNTAIGTFALLVNTTGVGNTAVGTSALVANTTGTSNTAIGLQSLSLNTTGSSNSALGRDANTGNFSGSTILGREATATANNQFVVGSAAYPAGAVTAETNTTISSWAVKINGTDRKLLLLDTAQNVIDVRQAVAASTSTTTVNWVNGNLADITLTSSTTFTLSTPVIGTYIVKLTQGGAGSFTVTWPATVKWSGGIAPVLTTTAGKIDVITLVWDGTAYYGSYALNF